MRAGWRWSVAAAVIAAGTAIAIGAASGKDGAGRLAADASWRTILKSPQGIEGLTGDDAGFLYVAARGGGANPCPVWRIEPSDGSRTVVGNVSAPCSPSGLAFGPDGRLYVTGSGAQSDQIAVLTPNADAPPTATVFASGVPGANGVAFDRDGNLWTGDGTTGQGRVWRISAAGAVTEVFRVPPTANSVGVGRQNSTLQPPGAPNPQPLVANGVAFTQDGTLLVADTARGALWRVDLDAAGDVLSPVGCDTTYAADTLCLDDLFVQHPALEGVDGIALDRAGNVWAAANERNAIVAVDRHGRVQEVFRNPPDATTRLRNQGPLELPTSPFLLGRTLCVTQSDGGRRDNAPNSGGEVGPGHPGAVAKISCLEQRLQVPGLPLPVGTE